MTREELLERYSWENTRGEQLVRGLFEQAIEQAEDKTVIHPVLRRTGFGPPLVTDNRHLMTLMSRVRKKTFRRLQQAGYRIKYVRVGDYNEYLQWLTDQKRWHSSLSLTIFTREKLRKKVAKPSPPALTGYIVDYVTVYLRNPPPRGPHTLGRLEKWNKEFKNALREYRATKEIKDADGNAGHPGS